MPKSLSFASPLVLTLAMSAAMNLGLARAQTVPSGHIEVLFVGNSFTFYHDMPQMFHQLALAAGKDVNVDEFVQGGQTLQGFWNDPKHGALDRVKSKPWDYVVLEGWTDPAADMRDWGTKFQEELLKVNPKAIVLMYMVNPAGPFPDDASLSDQQRHFVAIAQAHPNTILVPVEWAWKLGFKDDPKNEKWLAQDNWHPGPRRSYIAAVSIFATIYQQSPLGLAHKFSYPAEGDFTPDDANYLQNLAWTALRSHSTFTGFYNPPVATITEPAAGATYPEKTPIAFKVQTKVGDAPIVKVEYYNQSGKIAESVTPPFSFTWPVPPAGKFNVTVKPIDAKGLGDDSAPVFLEVTTQAKEIYTDDFKTGNATKWTLSNIGVHNGNLEGGAWNSDPSGTYDGAQYEGHYTYQCTVQGSGDVWRNYNLVFNYSDKSNYYCISVNGGASSSAVLKRMLKGTATTLATAPAGLAPSNSTTFIIHFSNGFISAETKQGESSQVLFTNVYDGSLTSGKIGFFTAGGMGITYGRVRVEQ